MISDQLLIIEVGTETGKPYMRNTDSFAWRLRQHRDAMGITQFEMCDRIVAVDDMRANGLSYLSSEDVRSANAWLRDKFRIVIDRAAPKRGCRVSDIFPLF